MVIADTIAPVADAAFATSGGDMTTATAWLGALAYTLQLYFDFSGYSDMAIGLGLMLGFKLPENFDRPYSAASDHRLLAALAHVAVALVPRLRLHPARRQPARRGEDLPQPDHHLRRHRLLARRQLDLPGLGPLPRGPDADRARDRTGAVAAAGLALGRCAGR